MGGEGVLGVRWQAMSGETEGPRKNEREREKKEKALSIALPRLALQSVISAVR